MLPDTNRPVLLTVVNFPDGTQATVKSLDWNDPQYEVCGFETVTTMPDGRTWGIGPEDDGDTVFSLHCAAIADAAREFLQGCP